MNNLNSNLNLTTFSNDVNTSILLKSQTLSINQAVSNSNYVYGDNLLTKNDYDKETDKACFRRDECTELIYDDEETLPESSVFETDTGNSMDEK